MAAAPRDWVGRGTGVDAGGRRKRKAEVIGEAVAFHRAGDGDPLEVLRRVGGREIAAMAGAILAARHQRVPVIVDGFVATAGGGGAARPGPGARSTTAWSATSRPSRPTPRCCGASASEPLLDLGMRLGEGSGAALAAGVVKGALACWRDMATFESAGVAKKDGCRPG